MEAKPQKTIVKTAKNKEESECRNLVWVGGTTVPKGARSCQNLAHSTWHDRAKILHLFLLNARDLAHGGHATKHDRAKQCVLSCFRVSSIIVAWSAYTNAALLEVI